MTDEDISVRRPTSTRGPKLVPSPSSNPSSLVLCCFVLLIFEIGSSLKFLFCLLFPVHLFFLPKKLVRLVLIPVDTKILDCFSSTQYRSLRAGKSGQEYVGLTWGLVFPRPPLFPPDSVGSTLLFPSSDLGVFENFYL